ncbi:hypothetical protein HYH02_005905 [Chlamydomonas schloesseri]|uniref:BTB domain-containing protein n=1 Tax=Chlamydomonas schloesseri TaxID=2026947 RepID=A0A835WK40_9CHLO|nr:hypothetical protein HYH02_005905 [Chlamydomonas schloesseri]|eukprot:KAG2449158.1 hypothetical protein HYH02_005905 [Chlamydomonas schloesseri]
MVTKSTYSHEWLISNFPRSKKEIETPIFTLAEHKWKLKLYPRQNREPHTHLSVFLHVRDLESALTVKYKLIVANWKDPSKSCGNEGRRVCRAPNANSGFSELFPLEQLTVASGFLRHDGALLLRLELLQVTQAETSDEDSSSEEEDSDEDPPRIYPATLRDFMAARSDLGADLLSLWERPGPTSDLTLVATAPAAADGSAAGGAAAGGSGRPQAVPGGARSGRAIGACGAGGLKQQQQQPGGPASGTRSRRAPSGQSSSSKGLAVATSDGGSTGRFDVHRAILAARCPYFATLFEVGMRDSTARELALPDTDPDALKPLLQFLYGGALTLTSRQQARACLALADRLLLPKAAALLRGHLLSTLAVNDVLGDLLWAADAGQAELLATLVDFAADAAQDVPEAGLQALAAAHPALMAQLFTAGRRAAKRSRT